MFCIKCGKQNMPGSAYCIFCGARLVSPEEAEALQNGAPAAANPDAPPIAPASAAPEAPQAIETATTNEDATTLPPTQYRPPPANQQGVPLPPYGGYNPYQSGPPQPPSNFRPPGAGVGYPYPPFPRPDEPQRYPVAPDGRPYIVRDHPEAFHAYKNKDNKQVYASYATLRARFLAAVIDTLLMYIPLQIIAWTVVIFTNPEIQQLIAQATTRFRQDELSRRINDMIPPWLSLALLTVYMLYCLLMTWRNGGQTIGKRITRIKIIRKDGSPPDFQTALTRNLFGYSWGLGGLFYLYGAFGATIGFILQLMVLMGFSAAFYDKQRRGWHDRLAETLVVGKQEIVQGVNY